jgi:hypothetical protein
VSGAADPWMDRPGLQALPGEEYECCASGSCEVCRRPEGGYSPARREQIRKDSEGYDPPWVRERREGRA